MSLHFLVAIAGSLVAAAGTGVLVARCLRVPNAALAAWTVAIFGLTVALGAQALGFGVGFGPISFRAMELGAQLVAPLALALGLAELVGRTITARFAARLLLTAVAIVSFVVLATDPLGAPTFSKAWPDPRAFYQIFPNKLLEYVLAPATVIVALIAIAVTAVRPSRDPAWRDALPAAAAASGAALMLSVPGVATLLNLTLPLGSLFTVLCVLAAGATWFAGVQVGHLRLDVLREDADVMADDDSMVHDDWGTQRSWTDGPGATGDFDPVAADGEFGIYRGNGTHRQRGDDLDYRDPGGYDEPEVGHDGFGDEHRYRDEAGYPSEPGYRDGDEYSREGEYLREAGYPQAPGPSAARSEPPPQLFGQIAIYTLLEERVDDFDRLTKQVVEQVRAQEPDTLVYIVHAVPSAPMQRILYEVYRDRAAYEAHKRQPYVLAFEADRRPYVLATNIIELGLQQAKVSPLPSVTDLLSDTGFDLLGDTGFGQPGYGPRSAGGPAAGGAGGATAPGTVGGAPAGGGRSGGITGGWTAGGGPADAGPGARRP